MTDRRVTASGVRDRTARTIRSLSRMPRQQQALVLLLVLGLLALLFDVSRAIGPTQIVRPLVGKADWTMTGEIFAYKSPPNWLEIPAPIVRDQQLMRWWSWSPKTGGTTGSVSTAPFTVPAVIAIPYVGFPNERPGNEIVLRCESDGRELNIATLRTNNQWATVFLSTAGFCSGQARLVARVADKGFFIGIGTPYEVSSALYYAQTQFGPRALIVILSWALILAIWSSCGCLATRVYGAVDPFAAGFVGVGAVGLVVFAAFTASPVLGRWMALGVAVSAILHLGVTLWRDPVRLRHLLASHRMAFLLWLGVALTYAAFVSTADSGGGSWAINGLFSPLRWSSDNQLPFLLAEGLLDGTQLDRIVFGSWYATDRTPLLSALLLLPRTLFVGPFARYFGSTFIPIGYMMAGITILSSWVAVVVWLCRRLAIKRLWIVLMMTMTSPFLLFNTVYIWPKILGASYVLVAFLLLCGLQSRTRKQSGDLVVVALCAVLAYLAHASNAFALVPLAAYFARSIRRTGLALITAAGLAAFLIYLPWAYWQIVVQPGGNALLRYALAGEYGFDKRQIPVLASAVGMYSSLSVQGWLAAKLQAFEQLVSMSEAWRQTGESARFSPGAAFFGAERIRDFFIVARTFGIAALGLVFIFMRRATPDLLPGTRKYLRSALVIGLSGIVLMIVATFVDTIVHAQAFGSLLLILIAGACGMASARPKIAAALTMLGIAYTAVVWVAPPLIVANRLINSAVVGMLFGIGLVAACLSASTKEESAT